MRGANTSTGFDNIQGVETIQGAGRVTVRVPGDVLFSSGKVSLRSSAKKTLSQIAGVINREYPDNMIRIEGYTDRDPIKRSRWKDNLELSHQRAAEVHRYLQKQGVDPQQDGGRGARRVASAPIQIEEPTVEIVVVLD